MNRINKRVSTGMQEPNLTFKVVVVGDGGVGKTTWIKSCLTNEFERKYVATLGVEVHPIRLRTSIGVVTLNMWDCAGVEKFGGLREGYYILANGAIVMADSNDPSSQEKIELWGNSVLQTTGSIPIVVVASKAEEAEPHFQHDFAISTRLDTARYEPLYALVRAMVGNPNIIFY